MNLSDRNRLNSTDTEHAEQSYVVNAQQQRAQDFIDRVAGDAKPTDQLEARALIEQSKPQRETQPDQVLNVLTQSTNKSPLASRTGKTAGRQIGSVNAGRDPRSRP